MPTEPSSGEIVERGSGRRDAILNAMTHAARPVADAFDVWGRAVKGAFGYGPGTYDDELLPAAMTLGGLAMTGGMAAARPMGSIGAGGRPRIPLTAEQLQIVREMHEAGRPARSIADTIGVSRPTVARTLQREDLPLRGAGAPGIGRLLTREQEIELMHLLAQGEKHEYLAARYGIDTTTIRAMQDRYARDKTRNGMMAGGLGMAGSSYDDDNMPSPNGWLDRRLSRRLPTAVTDYLTGGKAGVGSDELGYFPRSRFDYRRRGDDQDQPVRDYNITPNLDYSEPWPRTMSSPSDAGGGGSPYDEDTFMPMPADPRQSRMNTWLNQRLDRRLDQTPGASEMHRMMSERIPHMMTPPGYQPGSSPGGSDMDMMMLYGPEDQVAYDQQGRPIPLSDPRHPRNQAGGYNALSRQNQYPQSRR